MTKSKEVEISIMEIDKGAIDFCILGKSPLILNAMSEKTKRELLEPAQKKNAAAKAMTQKHAPLDEFRDSMYYARNPKSPTRIVNKATAWKNALRCVGVDLPGSSKAQIGRLTYVVGDEIGLYGLPEIMMAVTKQAGMNGAPDVRTRAVLPEWACRISVEYIHGLIKRPAIVNLMAAAGLMNGMGDWRTQKGNGDYGQFEIVEPDNPEFLRLTDTCGRDAQIAAIKNPECFDSETETLLSWHKAEVKRRGFRAVS
jgi:hypothetical protein